MYLYLDSTVFCEMQMEDHPEGRTDTCGERSAVWQLGFGRDVLAVFLTDHLARVLQAFWWANGYSLCFGRLSSSN